MAIQEQSIPASVNCKTCGNCKDVMIGKTTTQCGNPMVYLDHQDNVYRVTVDTPGCGFHCK